jgi:hypothetical protein
LPLLVTVSKASPCALVQPCHYYFRPFGQLFFNATVSKAGQVVGAKTQMGSFPHF